MYTNEWKWIIFILKYFILHLNNSNNDNIAKKLQQILNSGFKKTLNFKTMKNDNDEIIQYRKWISLS